MTHPKYGNRFVCGECGCKYYDLFKPVPACPKCGLKPKRAKRKTVKGAASKTLYVPPNVDDYSKEDGEDWQDKNTPAKSEKE